MELESLLRVFISPDIITIIASFIAKNLWTVQDKYCYCDEETL